MRILPSKKGDQAWACGWRGIAFCWAHFDVGFSYKRDLTIQIGRLVIRIGWHDG